MVIDDSKARKMIGWVYLLLSLLVLFAQFVVY